MRRGILPIGRGGSGRNRGVRVWIRQSRLLRWPHLGSERLTCRVLLDVSLLIAGRLPGILTVE